MRPKNRHKIRQDIFASILMFGFDLSRTNFIAAKRIATARKTNKSISQNEIWPSRPDIFLNCPANDPDGFSDDEMSEFFLHEKYALSSSDEEEDSEVHQVDDRRQSATYTRQINLLRRFYVTFDDWGTIRYMQREHSILRSKVCELTRN